MLAFTGLAGVFLIADDADATSFSVTSDADWVKVGERFEFRVSGDDDARSYEFNYALYDSSGKKMSGTSSSYDRDVSTSGSDCSFDAPKEAGNYRLVVTFMDKDKNTVAERVLFVKVVEPVTLSVTLYNPSDAKRTLNVYFVVNGERMEDSGKEPITIEANSSKTVTYEYVVRDLGRSTTFYVEAADGTLGGDVVVLGEEHSHTFYTAQNNYTFVEALAVIVLIIVVIAAIWIYRKPIKNLGKPKARR